jgi:transposase-like protein
MSKSKSNHSIRYTAEFRRQVVELVRAGRKPSELSREFGCTAWSIHRWAAQADRDAGHGDRERGQIYFPPAIEDTWEGRYKSSPVDIERYLLECSRYL